MKKFILPLVLLCSAAMAELPLKVRADQAMGQLQEKLKTKDYGDAFPWLIKVEALEKEGYKLPSAMGYFAGQVYYKNGYTEDAEQRLESYISNDNGKYFWDAVVLYSEASPIRALAWIEKYLGREPQPVHYQEALDLYSKTEPIASKLRSKNERMNKTMDQLKSTMGQLVDERDGKIYKTVLVDGKRWMAEDLRYADFLVGSEYEVQRAKISKKGIYGNDTKRDYFNKETICPNGWHLPKGMKREDKMMRGGEVWNPEGLMDFLQRTQISLSYQEDGSRNELGLSLEGNYLHLCKTESSSEFFCEFRYEKNFPFLGIWMNGMGYNTKIRCVQN
jgi:uncharacterized protein (TIGR02145 family)